MEESFSLENSPISITRHALSRLSQRGVPIRLAALILEHGDIALHAGNGCETVGLSRAAAEALIETGVPPDDAMRATRLKFVIANGSRAVTVLRDFNRSGRSYRRQGKTRASRRVAV